MKLHNTTTPDEQAALNAHLNERSRRSGRTCEWETAAPTQICGLPAAFVTTGKYVCLEHGTRLNRRWPGCAVSLECKTCYGHGMWALGDPCPMGPMDAAGGVPTLPCPECGANRNPPRNPPPSNHDPRTP